jgi:opacity protein-like surface antigen
MAALAASSAYGQFTAGIKAGVPITDTFDFIGSDPRTRFFSSTKRWVVGPSIELRLPGGLGFELDALYRKFSYERTSVTEVITSSGDHWEFPLLVKYRFPGVLARPFLDAGVSFNHISGLKRVGNFLQGQDSPEELRKKSATGFVVGAGVEISAIVLRVSPEIRYTRWGSANFRDINGLFTSNQNQAEFLVGFTF